MTQRTCIAIVDATRARLFVYERAVEDGTLDDGLTERFDLVDPDRRLTSNELYSDTRAGSNRMGNRHFAFDDGHDAHRASLDTEFARGVVAKVKDLVDSTASHRLVLCASPHMLGILRKLGGFPAGLAIEELARDLSKSSVLELRQLLTAHGLLPPAPARGGRDPAALRRSDRG